MFVFSSTGMSAGFAEDKDVLEIDAARATMSMLALLLAAFFAF